MNDLLSSWPPPFKFHINQRAKRISLRISQKKGLQITIPAAKDKNLALDFLHTKRTWVEKQLSLLVSPNQELPQELNFLAIQKLWSVRYEKTARKNNIRVINKLDEIVLVGDVTNITLCQKALIQVIKKIGEKYLIPWLYKLSSMSNLTFSAVNIRSQDSRWGSCSVDKNININCKLLFLPPGWVEYVLIHELCHTICFNHSDTFWKLVEKFIPNHLSIRKAMKKANQYIPDWV